MNLSFTHNELSELVNNKVSIRPTFITVDKNTLEVSYKPAIFMPTISVRFHIEAMCDNVVRLSYECGNTASLMIAGVVAYYEEKIPNGIEVNTVDKRVNIYLQRFGQIDKVLEHVALSDIAFEENSANIELTML